MSEASWNCVGSQRPTSNIVARCNSLTTSASQSSLADIPREAFIRVCKFLPPVDLFTLSIVCKKFRKWLVVRSNFGTEQIQRPIINIVAGCNSLTIPASQSSLVNIPCEVFINICKFLPPIDLFTLSIVCKKFRNWLVARSNFGTEQIWKTARINWLAHLRSPPSEISEQCYIFLNLIELGCQFCGNGRIDPNGDLPCDVPAEIYWCFRVRCCQRCFLEKTVTAKHIIEEGRINSDILRVLPYYAKNNRPLIYWKSQVETAYQEYLKLDSKDLDKWMQEKSIQLRNVDKISTGCEGQVQAKLLKKEQVSIKLKFLINKLSLVVPNDANRLRCQVEVELKRCPTYKKFVSDNRKEKLAIRLFSEGHWDRFQDIIRKEYEEKRKYAALRARQFDIFCKIYSMVPEKFSMNDPIVKYLPYCLSFKRPYWDVIVPWKDNFLEEELIPLLCDEAAAIAKKSRKAIPITTPAYALNNASLKNRRIFQCKLCANQTPMLNHKEIRLHLRTHDSRPWEVSQACHHHQRERGKCNNCKNNGHRQKESILHRDDKKTITVDYLAVGKSILKRDSKLVCFFFPLDE